ADICCQAEDGIHDKLVTGVQACALPISGDAKLALVITITEGIPVNDMVKAKRFLQGTSTRLLGPNCPGVITPGGKCKIGIMPGRSEERRVGKERRSRACGYE